MGSRETAFWNLVGASLQPILKFADKTNITGKLKPKKATLPVPHTQILPSSKTEVDTILQRLDETKQQWLHVGAKKRAELLTACLNNVLHLAKMMATVGTVAKGSYEGGIGDEL